MFLKELQKKLEYYIINTFKTTPESVAYLGGGDWAMVPLVKQIFF